MSFTGARWMSARPWMRARGTAPAMETPPRRSGDELQELAETFRLTVERLSTLVTELESAHQLTLQAEIDKKHFYREVIRAVTRDRFLLVDAGGVPPCGRIITEIPVIDGPGYAAARRAIWEAGRAIGMSEERIGDLVLCAGEAITNAMKHARDGRCMVCQTPNSVVVRVTDEGSGILSHDLPAALLLPGYSTKVSLGMGYKMILRLCDRLWLSTGPEGTTVQMEMKIEPPSDAQQILGAAMDRL